MLNEDQIFELNAVGMLIFTVESFTIRRINEKAANIYENHEHDLAGSSLSRIFSEKEINWLKSSLADRNSKEPSTLQIHSIKTKQKRYVRLKLHRLKPPNNIQYALITFTDITDDVLKNRRLNRQEKFLKLINEFNIYLRKRIPYRDWFDSHSKEISELLNIQELEYLKLKESESDDNSYRIQRKFSFNEKYAKLEWPDVSKEEFTQHVGNLHKSKTNSLLRNDLKAEYKLHKYLLNRGGATYLFVPVCADDNLKGFFCIEDEANSRTWEKDELDFLTALADDLGMHLETKEQRRQIEESEKKFRELVQGGADLIGIIDAQANYTYVSPSVFNNLGFTAEYFIGKNAFEFIHPDDQEWVGTYLQVLEKQPTVTIPPYRFQDASGEWNYLTTVLTDKREHPQIMGIIANSQNITEVVKIRKELELANERYKLAAQAASDHIYDWDINLNHVTRLGNSLEKIWGYTPEDVARLEPDFWKQCVHPQDKERTYSHLMDCLGNAEVTHCSSRYRFKKANGEYSEILDQGFIIRSKSGKALRLVGAVKDISELVQKEAEEDLYLRIAKNFNGKFDNLDDCLELAVNTIVSDINAFGGEFWLRSADREFLNLVQRYASPDLESFYKQTEGTHYFAKKQGLAGEVWHKGKSIMLSDLNNSKVFLRRNAGQEAGIQSAVGVPIFDEEDLVGVLLLFSDNQIDEISGKMRVLESVCSRIGSLISKKILEDDLNNFFNLSPDYLCILGTDGILKKVNKAIIESTGYSERELTKTPLKNFLHPEDRERGVRQIAMALNKEKLGLESTRFIGKKGQTIHLIWSSHMDPKKKQVYAVAKDITLRVHAQNELNIAYNRLRQAQRIAKLGYWSRPLGERNYWWSEQLYNIFELTPDQFKPNLKNVFKMVHPADQEMAEMNHEDILNEKDEYSYRHRIITGSGAEKWVLQRIWVRRDDSGKTVAFEGTLQDISEQVQYEENLRISNERFQLAMKATREMIWDWDHQTDIITRGMGYETSFGYKPNDSASKANSWFSMVHRDDIDNVWHSIDMAMNDPQQTKWEAEYRLIPEPGKLSYVIDRGFIIRDENNKPLRSVGSTLDVTETRKHLREIENQNKALRDIAHMQSHVIRAPLARIMGIIELVKTEEWNDQIFIKYLDLISSNAKDLDDVIRAITVKTYQINEDH